MFDIKLHERCNYVAQFFILSVNKGYDSKNFVEEVMQNENLSRVIFESRFNYEGLDFKRGKTLSGFMMWFLGYTYAYWVFKYKKKPTEVYNILSFNDFVCKFNEYCNENCEFIIKDAMNNYKECNNRDK